MSRKEYRNILLHKRYNQIQVAPSMLIYDKDTVERIGRIILEEEDIHFPWRELPPKVTFKIDRQNPNVQALSTHVWKEMLVYARYKGQVPIKWITLSQSKTKSTKRPKREKHV